MLVSPCCILLRGHQPRVERKVYSLLSGPSEGQSPLPPSPRGGRVAKVSLVLKSSPNVSPFGSAGPPSFVWGWGDRFGEPVSVPPNPTPSAGSWGLSRRRVSFSAGTGGKPGTGEGAGGGAGVAPGGIFGTAVQAAAFLRLPASTFHSSLAAPSPRCSGPPHPTRVPIQEKGSFISSFS